MNTKIKLLILTLTGLSILNLFAGCDPNESDKNDENCDTCIVAYKPNIYIYPDIPRHLTVSLEFPQGGHVIHSEPLYNSGWSFMADTNGWIDNQYRYLFYESQQPNVWQTKQGWIIAKEQLKSFFEENLRSYGFNLSEINDFTEYWVPRLNQSPYYIIYPQTRDIIEKVIVLNVSEKPENLLRLFYFIKETNKNDITIQTPVIPCEFMRIGYTIAEWGVLID